MKKRKLQYMPFFVSDFLGSSRVQELHGFARGIYALLLIHHWNRMPDALPTHCERIARLLGLTLEEWKSVESDILPFFTEEDGKLFHPRIIELWESSISRRKSRSNAAREAALSRWRDASRMRDAMPDACETHSDRNASECHPSPSPSKNPPYPPLPGGACVDSAPPPGEDRWRAFVEQARTAGVGNPIALAKRLRESGVADPADSGYAWWTEPEAAAQDTERRELVDRIRRHDGATLTGGDRVLTVGLKREDGIALWADVKTESLRAIAGELEQGGP